MVVFKRASAKFKPLWFINVFCFFYSCSIEHEYLTVTAGNMFFQHSLIFKVKDNFDFKTLKCAEE